MVRCCLLLLLIASLACRHSRNKPEPRLFEVHKANRTGLAFNNLLTPRDDFNMFNYMYFYNGAGVGAGDFNNDGLTDLFFAANQVSNKMYLNEGKLHFKDVTDAAGVPQDGGWATGVSVVDINNDGLLDIYICKVGSFAHLKGYNQLLVCKGIKEGIPVYAEEATAYGLAFSGFSTQAAFFDYDLDGDLDMYLLNHSVHQNSSFSARAPFLNTFSLLSGDRLYKNENNHFTDVTAESKINSTQIGYGLGIAISDINLDGWPDIYIGNDFHENDYLYINQRDGSFKEEIDQRLMHTSKFTMGVEIADLTNDGYPEILSMDMLAADPYILKRSLGDDDYDVFFSKIAAGYNYQYSRNNLQYNRRNGLFSEAGVYAGIAATDWSWGPLFLDFDNDGLKDLFISNGIPKRLNDMDYINFIYNREIQEKLKNNDLKGKDMALIDKFPEIKIPNKFYKNQGNLQFRDMLPAIGNDQSTYSNGAVYADFDNDGDLDVVVNNINDAALLYENKTVARETSQYLSLQLSGPPGNKNAIGAKLVLFVGKELRLYEKYQQRGFLSSMEIPLHAGLGAGSFDSAWVVWPDNRCQRVVYDSSRPRQHLSWQNSLPLFDYRTLTDFHTRPGYQFSDITATTGLTWMHQENNFNEFDREPLLPHLLSTEGPAMAVGDINHDGLTDVFIGSASTFQNAVFLQQPGGKFSRTYQPSLAADSMHEDVASLWADVNGDTHPDLVIASGGNEFYGPDKHLLPRVYLNDGKGNLTRLPTAINGVFVNASCIAANDFNGDGFVDLFVGGRSVPWNYGEPPRSYLLANDGTGHFTDVTLSYARELAHAGMITGAVWQDITNDRRADLILTTEWGGITAFTNQGKRFTPTPISARSGWWSFITPVDIDNDGDMDFIAGNTGLNNRLKATEKEPVRMYFNDFDDNGKKEQVVSHYVQGKEVSFASKDELQNQLPFIKKKYIYAADFASATFPEIWPAKKLKSATTLSANYFANVLLINNGNLTFETRTLPWEAQLTAYRDAVITDVNKDGLPDVLLVGNFYGNTIHAGRADADFGTLLINQGKGALIAQPLPGIAIKGEVRGIKELMIGRQQAFLVAKNNDSLKVIQLGKP